jgi:hypothetical protein
MNKNHLKKQAKMLAARSLQACDEALDGDDTEYLAGEFLKELNKLNGNT